MDKSGSKEITPQNRKAQSAAPAPAEGEVISYPAASEATAESEVVEQPAKIFRLGGMLRQLLEEVKEFDLDEKSRTRLKEIYEISVVELGSALSEDLQKELDRIALPFGDGSIPTEAELLVAKAQLVGWLEGLVKGIQATLFAQEIAARNNLASMRTEVAVPPSSQTSQSEKTHGTYL